MNYYPLAAAIFAFSSANLSLDAVLEFPIAVSISSSNERVSFAISP